MLRNEFVFPSADGNTSIHAVQWLPEDDVRAVVQISHGVSEYILRYEPFAQYLTDRGLRGGGPRSSGAWQLRGSRRCAAVLRSQGELEVGGG